MGGTPKPRKISTLLPEQKAALQQALGGAQQAFPAGLEAILGQLDPEAGREQFQRSVADPALREFRSSIIPAILSSSAAAGSRRAGPSERQLAQAGQQLELGLAEQFAGQQAGQQQAGIQNLMNLLFPGVGQQAFALQERRPGFGQQLFGGALGLAGTLGGAALSRPRATQFTGFQG